MTDQPLYLKATTADGSAPIGVGRWKLPRGSKPGAWMPPIEGELIPCQRGYHLVPVEFLMKWANDRLWIAEYDGELVGHEDKVVVRRARILSEVTTWTKPTIAGLGLDFAERAALHAAEALPRWTSAYPEDGRPAAAIEAANAAVAAGRQFLQGEGDVSAASAASAAESAAWSAESAARSAASAARSAESAAWSAWSARSAASAARSAASAAESAAWSARSAAWSAWSAAITEIEWQVARIVAVLGLPATVATGLPQPAAA